jgi:membrane-associated phospholipid phosphatase
MTKTASVISNVLSPPAVSAMIGFALAFVAAPFLPALIAGAVHGVLVSLIPLIYILVMLKRGVITDLHMRNRHERHMPNIIAVGGALLAWAILRAFDAPLTLQRLALLDAILLGILGVINVWWQISAHTAVIFGAVTVCGVVFGLPVALSTSPLALAVPWARLYLKRHTVRQVIAGAALGAMLALLVFSVL